MTHHNTATTDVGLAQEITRKLKSCEGLLSTETSPSAATREIAVLYKLLRTHETLTWLEGFEQSLHTAGLDPEYLHTIGRWLARNAPDREAVKAGMAWMSLVSGIWDHETFLTLGSHDEFTLFSAVAIRRKTDRDQGDQLLFSLAQAVTGWGRIHAIERLDGSRDPLVRDWLVREGYRNDIMHEYTALVCARTVDIAALLGQGAWDRGLITGTGDILAALLAGNQEAAEGMDSYTKGAEACALWIDRLREASCEHLVLEDYPIIRLILERCGSQSDFAADEWTLLAGHIREGAEALIDLPCWTEKVSLALGSEREEERSLAKRVGDGIRRRSIADT